MSCRDRLRDQLETLARELGREAFERRVVSMNGVTGDADLMQELLLDDFWDRHYYGSHPPPKKRNPRHHSGAS